MGNVTQNYRSEIVLSLALLSVALISAIAFRKRDRVKILAEQVGTWFDAEEQPSKYPMWSLFLASFATLYIEIMMIRWIGTEVRIFAYFQNLALISCFLGFGLGCYWSGRKKRLLVSLLAMAGLVLLTQLPLAAWRAFLFHMSNQLSLSPDMVQWGLQNWGLEANFRGMTVALLFAVAVVVVTVFLLLLIAVMVPLGQWVGYHLDAAPHPIQAYTLNLLGSVAGIWVFAGMAFYWLPVRYWFVLGFLILLFIQQPSKRLIVTCLVLLSASLLLLHFPTLTADQTYWSPYQKLALLGRGNREYSILVNNVGYMGITNLTPERLASNPEFASRYKQESSYDAPYRFAQSYDRVLIVGAGAGNDAAAALRNGAGHVDAVEIDPVIYLLGKRLHPEHPYDSPRVNVIINDARAFMRRAQGSYDVIVFGTLDSHTQFSDYSNMRIDNYVYTEEAFREAKRLLKPNGVLIVRFEIREPWMWMGQRFYVTLNQVFDRHPVVCYIPSLGPVGPVTLFVTSKDAGLWARAGRADLAALVSQHPPHFPLSLNDAPPTATDDWPYLYVRGHSIPRTYLTVSVILLALAILLVGKVLNYRETSTWHFFLLGAGFLLLETQLISRLALYFGTTWLVNCVALTGILLVLVIANFVVARKRPRRLGPYYVLLVLTLLVNYLFPWQQLPYPAQTIGILLSVAYLFPIFFAGIIFTESFRRCEHRSSAFGANIVGAVAGGLAQNVSFVVGMKALLPLAALFYAAAGMTGLLETRRTVPAPAPTD